MDAAIRVAWPQATGPVGTRERKIFLSGMRAAAKFADMPEPGGHPLAAVIAKHIRAAADELEQTK
jgi:hypothetical protein